MYPCTMVKGPIRPFPIRLLKPHEMFRAIALTGPVALVMATTVLLAPLPARAQIGNIFSEPAPRPPSNIPRGNQQQLPSDDEEEVPALPGQGVPPPRSVQSQPRPPPPGTTVIPQNAPPTVAIAPPEPSQPPAPGTNPALPGLPPGQRQPKGVPQSPATFHSGDAAVTE